MNNTDGNFKNDFWKLKIAAFLHDPLNKALMLGRKDEEYHETYAKKLLLLFGIEESFIDRIKKFDRIAASFDRSLFEELKDKNGNPIKVSFVRSPYIVHPLSADKYDLSKYGVLKNYKVNWDKLSEDEKIQIVDAIEKHAKDTIETMLKFFLQLIGEDENKEDRYKKLFFLLWRYSIPVLRAIEGSKTYDKEKYENRLGYLWELLPADTRLPNHSVYLHNITTSALVNTENGAGFFIFTIGPVQRFISKARKTNDFLSGSLMLAYLIFRSMEPVIKEYGPDSIIFPNMLSSPLLDLKITEDIIPELKNWNDINENDQLYHVKKALYREYQNSIRRLFIPSIPNRFFAIIPDDDIEETVKEVEEAFNKAKDALFEDAYKEIKEKFENFNEQLDEKFMNDLKERHKNSSFEYYFVVNRIKWDRALSRNTYKNEYSLTESAIGARKRIREFEQFVEKGEKCTICGERSVFMPFEATKREDYRDVWGKIHENDATLAKNENEQLCLLDILKRKFPEIYAKKLNKQYEIDYSKIEKYQHAPSISQIAFSEFIEKFWEIAPSYVKDFKKWVEAIKPFQESILPDDFYVEKVAENSKIKKVNLKTLGIGIETPLGFKLSGELYDVNGYKRLAKEYEKDNAELEKKIENAGKVYAKIVKKIKEEYNIAPEPYYGIINFDGDKMGKWLSGDNLGTKWDYVHPDVDHEIDNTYKDVLKEKQNISPSIHRYMSYALSTFAKEIVSEIIKEHYGFLVYAGGDDVLALLPEKHVFDAAFRTYMFYGGMGGRKKEEGYSFKTETAEFESNSSFVRIKKGNKIERILPTMGQRATASAGIVLAHYLTPLSTVIEKSIEAEHYAKEVLGRNTFGIYLLKRSGEHIKTGDKWIKEIDKDREKQFPAFLFFMLLSDLMNNENDALKIEGRLKEIDIFLEIEDNIRKLLPKLSLSDSFVVELWMEFSEIMESSEGEEGFREMLLWEIKRLLSRKLSLRKNYQNKEGRKDFKNLKKDIVEFLTCGIMNLYEKPDAFEEDNPADEKVKIIHNRKRFFDLLNVARFIARRSSDE